MEYGDPVSNQTDNFSASVSEITQRKRKKTEDCCHTALIGVEGGAQAFAYYSTLLLIIIIIIIMVIIVAIIIVPAQGIVF